MTELVPQWRVAHFSRVGGTSKRKPKVLMWVLRLDLRQDATGLTTVKGIEIVQSANASNAKAWHDATTTLVADRIKGQDDKVQSGSGVGGEKGALTDDDDPFFANAPTLSEADFVVDKSKFETFDMQLETFCNKMKTMARRDHDEEDGWEFFARATGNKGASTQGIDVYRRSVDWSSAPQYRSRCVAQATVEVVFEQVAFVESSIENATKIAESKEKIKEMGKSKDKRILLTKTDGSTYWRAIIYRFIRLPWPLSDRALFYVVDYVLLGKQYVNYCCRLYRVKTEGGVVGRVEITREWRECAFAVAFLYCLCSSVLCSAMLLDSIVLRPLTFTLALALPPPPTHTSSELRRLSQPVLSVKRGYHNRPYPLARHVWRGVGRRALDKPYVVCEPRLWRSHSLCLCRELE